MKGLGLLNGTNPEAMSVAETALTHPAAGVRKTAIQVLSGTPGALSLLKKYKMASDPDLRVRLASVILMADLNPSDAIATSLSEMLKDSINTKDEWINKALKAAIGIHRGTSVSSTVTKSTVPDQVINISVIKDQMKYNKTSFTVKAGSVVRIVLKNTDFMQHNLLVLKPGSTEKVGAAADALARDPKGADLQYVPKLREVLFHTPLVNPQKTSTITFRVPKQTGDYPYVCTFPGHWKLMNGLMKVVSK
jgi:azurin